MVIFPTARVPEFVRALAGHYPPALIALALAVVIATLPVPVAAALVVGVSMMLLSFLNPLAGICLLALAVPLGSLELSLGGMSISAVEPLAAILLAAWLLRIATRQQKAIFLPFGLLPTALFAGLLLLGATFAPVESLALKEVLRWLELLAVALVAYNVLNTRRQIALVVGCLIAAGALEGIVGWGQFLLRMGPPSFAIGRFSRAYGTFGQPNPFAGYLGMIWPLAASVAVFSLIYLAKSRPSADRKLPLLAVSAGVVIGVAILMSLSRGAWLGAGLAALVLAGLLYRKLFVSLPVLAVLVVAFVLVQQLELLPATIAQRVNESLSYFRIFDASKVQATPQNWAVVERMASWQAAWGMFQTNPIFGVGPGQYVAAYPRFALPTWPQPLGHAHNFYLNVMAETGLIGIAAYLMVLAGWFAAGISMLNGMVSSERGFERAVVIGVIAALTASAVHNIFDNLYVQGMNAHVGLLLGVLFAAGRICRGGLASSTQTNRS